MHISIFLSVHCVHFRLDLHLHLHDDDKVCVRTAAKAEDKSLVEGVWHGCRANASKQEEEEEHCSFNTAMREEDDNIHEDNTSKKKRRKTTTGENENEKKQEGGKHVEYRLESWRERRPSYGALVHVEEEEHEEDDKKRRGGSSWSLYEWIETETIEYVQPK